jgi:formimidoylglutamate deiminase
MPDRETLLWAPLAWTPDGWRERVLLGVGDDGHWSRVTADVPAPAEGAKVLRGPLLPGLVNAHSHAFQRAFAGRAERREAEHDDFWSWRDRMYRVALRISPDQLRAVAAQLYVELLRGGYTHVCEFHYLQHDLDGRPYDDPLEMSWALADAAAEAGIGLTLLPVLYERAGFTSPLRNDQRRFETSVERVWSATQAIADCRRPGVKAGLAIHSLRAASAESIHALRVRAEGFAGPIHIHVAEQTAEVDDCLRVTGKRPVEWLAHERLLDRRWQLVHATHTVPREIDAVAASGAGVVLCPSTEANLGDGLADLPGWLDAGVAMTIGSDSHVTRDWREELRWLDYGQRLAQRRRNIAASPASGRPSTAESLFARSAAGGAAASGEPAWGLVAGARADALVVDGDDDALRGLAPGLSLDALVFSSPSPAWSDVMVAGRWTIRGGRHVAAAAIGERFAATMRTLD